MALVISRLTREYVFTNITTPNDLTTSTGELAFMAPGSLPETSDWYECDLVELSPAQGDATWAARLLVGDGVNELESPTLASPDSYPYDWQVWLRITDNPERPVRRPGIITVE